ncbi:trypsin-like peptidase domain-containing protein [Microcoleus sp. FACHB-53]|nr:trypsin-like peptidase domain-containing protein [Microcoleus sp. FACHB-53]
MVSRYAIALLLSSLLLELTDHILLDYPTIPLATISQEIDVSVLGMAKRVTVRILSDSGLGSGVIINRKGQIYTVLTNRHVVADDLDNTYTLLTADGQMHSGRWRHSHQFGELDLAVVQFKSPRFYQVAVLGNSSKLVIGEPVFAAGFPNWEWKNHKSIESTRDWGLKAFRLTRGRVGMLPKRSLAEGYQLGYTNDIAVGMSGGPVFNRDGKLVGINGRAKYPLAGIEGFTFTDGTVPSQILFQRMEALSWAIPIDKFESSWVR